MRRNFIKNHTLFSEIKTTRKKTVRFEKNQRIRSCYKHNYDESIYKLQKKKNRIEN